jgi:hypothetical protein
MNRITEVTRRDILDALAAEKVKWSGRLDEIEFLWRLYDLLAMPSTDDRFPDAATDIWQHRVNNNDWDDGWVFSDSRFGLMHGDDEVLLRFLCEALHPIVRPDVTEAERLCQLFNQFLRNDGFEIKERTRISGKPVFAARYVGVTPAPGLALIKQAIAGTDPGYVTQQITRMEAAVGRDPDLAIGTAKELVETCCRTILRDRGVTCSGAVGLTVLVKQTAKTLALTPEDIPEKARAAAIIKRLLSNLGTIAQGIAELRNLYGTGHGKEAGAKGLGPRHAKLAVGAAATLAVFLVETHNIRAK